MVILNLYFIFSRLKINVISGQVLSVHKKEEPFNTGRKGKGYSMRMTSSFKSSRIISD